MHQMHFFDLYAWMQFVRADAKIQQFQLYHNIYNLANFIFSSGSKMYKRVSCNHRTLNFKTFILDTSKSSVGKMGVVKIIAIKINWVVLEKKFNRLFLNCFNAFNRKKKSKKNFITNSYFTILLPLQKFGSWLNRN